LSTDYWLLVIEFWLLATEYGLEMIPLQPQVKTTGCDFRKLGASRART
jgi:hypothetical protein